MTNRLIAICGLFFFPLSLSTSLAEEGQESVKELIRIQVLLVESIGDLNQDERGRLSGEIDSVMSAINQLTRDGKLQMVNHAELAMIEEQPATLQTGEIVALRTGSVRASAGRTTNVYRDVSVGTLIKLTAKVVENEVLVDINFAKAFVAEEEEDGESPQSTSQITHRSTLKIKNENAHLIGRITTRGSDDANRGVLIIVAVERLNSAGEEQSSEEASVIGDVKIEFIPELGTIMLRGKSNDVKRVQKVIEEIQRRSKENQGENPERKTNSPD